MNTLSKLRDWILIACTATFMLAIYIIFYPIYRLLKEENEIPLPNYRGPFPDTKDQEL